MTKPYELSNAPFVMLAPMEGVVDAVTRALYSEIGGFDRFVTEFIRVTDRLLPAHLFYKYCPELKTSGKTKEGVPVFVQLLGGRPTVIAENAALAVSLGAHGIDLNFGCPARTVNRHDGGATLLKDPRRLYDIITTVKAAVSENVPVTAKVRLGFHDKSLVTDIARAVDEAGAAMLTVHARTRDEGYKPPAHWEYIYQMKEVIKHVPVVANGDIWTVDDYLKCREVSGCDAVALGRGAIATPDLALQIRACLGQVSHKNYDWAHVASNFLLRFARDSENYRDSSYAVARTKQWVRQLMRTYPEAAKVFEEIKLLQSASDLYSTLGS